MFFKTIWRRTAIVVLFSSLIAGCNSVRSETAISSTPAISETTSILPTSPTISEITTSLPAIQITPTIAPEKPTPTVDLAEYAFPDSIDPSRQYMFYLHGKIIEDQGIPAISPDYGEYEYAAILEKLREYGFVVISEKRSKDTDGVEYARKIAEQVMTMMNAGVPAKNITVVGASKGAGIVIYVSHFLENEDIRYVILAICHPDEVAYLVQNQNYLHGNVLSIYDSVDEFAGSCQELFAFSQGKGMSRHDEIILNIGTGHGILYKPLDEWIIPTIRWARKP